VGERAKAGERDGGDWASGLEEFGIGTAREKFAVKKKIAPARDWTNDVGISFDGPSGAALTRIARSPSGQRRC